jgi:membrane associated rhomboid family serine protease
MIPIRDENPNNETPYVTYALLGLNAVVWIFVQGAGFGTSLESSICEYGFISQDLFGSGGAAVCPPSSTSPTLSLVTSMFMHGGWMHLLGNMLFLWVFGDNVEDSMGHLRFLIFYLIGGIIAALSQGFADPQSGIPMVGASGAIGCVMGGYLMLYPRVKVTIAVFFFILFWTFRVPAYLMLGYWIGVQLLSGLTTSTAGGGVAFWAHFGGFVSGCVLVYFFKDKELLANHKFYGWTDTRSEESIWDDPRNRQ